MTPERTRTMLMRLLDWLLGINQTPQVEDRMAYESKPGNNSPGLHTFDGPYIHLQFQDGPVPEHGENGTTNEEVIQLLIDRITSLNEMYDGKYACTENERAISCLQDAREWLLERTRRRVERGVEGTMTP